MIDIMRRLFAKARRRPLRTVSGSAVLDLVYDADRRPLQGTVTWTFVDTAEEEDR